MPRGFLGCPLPCKRSSTRIIEPLGLENLGQLSPTQGRELALLDAQGHVPPAAATQVRSELRFPSWTRSPLKTFTNNADVDYF